MAAILVNIGLLMPAPSGVSVAQASFPSIEIKAKSFGMSQMASDQEIDIKPAQGPADGAILHSKLNYDLDAVLKGQGDVPRIMLASLPDDLFRLRESHKRKTLFLKTVLPLVLHVNEQILDDRARLQALVAQQKSEQTLDALDRLWLAVMAQRYGTRRGDIEAILNRHDVVPPSLALAQAATESAWGSSRFVREGNAMFGQWTFSASHPGIVPSKRQQGKSHRVRAFGSLYESIHSYMTNLNKHRAYQEFRDLRASLRSENKPLDGMRLAGTLYRYSERGAAYVAELRAIISSNELRLVDGAQLSPTGDIKPLI